MDELDCLQSDPFLDATCQQRMRGNHAMGIELQRCNQHRYRASAFLYQLCRQTAREEVGQAICPAFDPTEQTAHKALPQ